MFYFLQSYDFITIYDGPQNIYNQTGKVFPQTIQSSNLSMTIGFSSGDKRQDNTMENAGFEIAVEFVSSGIAGTQVNGIAVNKFIST